MSKPNSNYGGALLEPQPVLFPSSTLPTHGHMVPELFDLQSGKAPMNQNVLLEPEYKSLVASGLGADMAKPGNSNYMNTAVSDGGGSLKYYVLEDIHQ